MSSSRSALAVLSFAAALSTAGCLVPQSKLDDANKQLAQEKESHLRTEGELARVRADISRIDEILRQKEQSLQAREGELAQTKLDVDREAAERQDAANLVEQLRGELARVGDHLRDFSNQKRELEVALNDAEARNQALIRQEASVRDKVLVMRDLSYGLAEFVIDDKAVVTAVADKPAVRLDAKALFGKKDEVTPEAKAMFERIARASKGRPTIRVIVADRSEDSSPDDRTLRLARVASALSSEGLPKERIDLGELTPPPPEAGTAPQAPGPTGTPAAAAAPPGKPADGKVAPPQKARGPRWQDGPGSIELTFDVVAA